jgi:hypothetical protein
MVRITRRGAIAISAVTTGLIATGTIIAQEEKKPVLYESAIKKDVDSLIAGVYKDALAYGIELPEDYTKRVPVEIWPDVKLILGRRYTVIDK